jgi:hypothetical protein
VTFPPYLPNTGLGARSRSPCNLLGVPRGPFIDFHREHKWCQNFCGGMPPHVTHSPTEPDIRLLALALARCSWEDLSARADRWICHP